MGTVHAVNGPSCFSRCTTFAHAQHFFSRSSPTHVHKCTAIRWPALYPWRLLCFVFGVLLVWIWPRLLCLRCLLFWSSLSWGNCPRKAYAGDKALKNNNNNNFLTVGESFCSYGLQENPKSFLVKGSRRAHVSVKGEKANVMARYESYRPEKVG